MASSTLHLCPCCNKLVPASHFRRAPWTEQDLSELLTNPRLQKVIEARVEERMRASMQSQVRQLVEEVLAGMAPQVVMAQGRKPRQIPAGYLTYKQASERYGYSEQTVRHYVSTERVVGGGGLVLESSMRDLAAARTDKSQRA